MTEIYTPPPFDPAEKLYRCPLAMLHQCPMDGRCFHAKAHMFCGDAEAGVMNWCGVMCTHTQEEIK